MLKWAQFVDEDTLYEAFLPESDLDGRAWVLRAIRRRHVVAERRVPMVHRPTFGPDSGDVLALEKALDRLIDALRSAPAPESVGTYQAGEICIAPPDPMQHGFLHMLRDGFLESAEDLDLDPAWISALLGLSEGRTADQLYPVAITPLRQGRMERVVALRSLLPRYPSLASQRTELLDAILRDDVGALRSLLNDAGVKTG